MGIFGIVGIAIAEKSMGDRRDRRDRSYLKKAWGIVGIAVSEKKYARDRRDRGQKKL